MNILKKLNVENDKLVPAYAEKVNLKNYWLQKRETKEQAKEHNAKLDEIAKFVTKYIKKFKDKG